MTYRNRPRNTRPNHTTARATDGRYYDFDDDTDDLYDAIRDDFIDDPRFDDLRRDRY